MTHRNSRSAGRGNYSSLTVWVLAAVVPKLAYVPPLGDQRRSSVVRPCVAGQVVTRTAPPARKGEEMFSKLKSGLVIGAAAAALATVSIADAKPIHPSQHPDPVTISGSCKVPKVEIIASNVELDGDGSTEWEDISDAKIDFSTRRIGCVIITFSGVAVTGNEVLRVQMLLDGTTACGAAYGEPVNTVFAAQAVQYAISSMTYFCKDVPPGDHYVQAQYTTFWGGIVDLMNHTMTVAHR